MADLFTDVRIKGDVFEVDIIAGEMRYKSDRKKVIRFSDMQAIPKTLSVFFLYDSQNKTAFVPKPGLRRLPEEVLLVELYSPPALDPVTYYRERNIHHDLVEPRMFFLRLSTRKVRVIPRVAINRDQFFVSAVDGC